MGFVLGWGGMEPVTNVLLNTNMIIKSDFEPNTHLYSFKQQKGIFYLLSLHTFPRMDSWKNGFGAAPFYLEVMSKTSETTGARG